MVNGELSDVCDRCDDVIATGNWRVYTRRVWVAETSLPSKRAWFIFGYAFIAAHLPFTIYNLVLHIVNLNVEPCPTLLSTQILPLPVSTIS